MVDYYQKQINDLESKKVELFSNYNKVKNDNDIKKDKLNSLEIAKDEKKWMISSHLIVKN